MSNSFFKWIEDNSPGFTKEIYHNFEDAIKGKVRNPFQWKATQWALETEFSKATQKVEQEHTGNVRFQITRGESIQSTPDSNTDNQGQTSV